MPCAVCAAAVVDVLTRAHRLVLSRLDWQYPATNHSAPVEKYRLASP